MFLSFIYMKRESITAKLQPFGILRKFDIIVRYPVGLEVAFQPISSTSSDLHTSYRLWSNALSVTTVTTSNTSYAMILSRCLNILRDCVFIEITQTLSSLFLAKNKYLTFIW